MPLPLFGIVPLVVIFIVLLIIMAKEKTFDFIKFYFTIVSIAGVIGMVVAFGSALYQYFDWQLVDDDEYIAGSHSFYEIQNCEQSNLPAQRPLPENPAQQAATGNRTAAEIEACKEQATTRILNQRDFNKKQNIIEGVVWGVLFAVLFASHFPFMLKREQK